MKMFIFKIIILIIFNRFSEGNLLSRCLDRYIEITTNNLFVLIEKKNKSNGINSKFPHIKIRTNNVDLLHEITSTPNVFTISYESLNELNTTFSVIAADHLLWKPVLSNYIIISNSRDDLIWISKLLWSFHFYKNIFVLPLDTKIEIFTINYKKSRCGNKIKYKKINEFIDDGFIYRLKSIAPDIKNDFKRCPFRIGFAYETPFALKSNKTNEPIGILSELLSVFSTDSFEITYHHNQAYLDEITEYRFDTAIEDFDSGLIDTTLTVNFFLQQKYLFVPIKYDKFYMLIPKPSKIPVWKYNFLIYNPEVWVCLYLILVGVSLLLYLLGKLTKNSDRKFYGNSFIETFMKVVSFDLNVPVAKLPISWNLRILIGFHLFFCLLELTYRQAKMTSFTATSLYEKPIKNMEDFIESDIPLKLFYTAQFLFQSDSKIYDRIEFVETDSFYNLPALAYKEHFATAWAEVVFITQPLVYDGMNRFPIATYQLGFLMPDNHAYYEYFDTIIKRILESGFLEYIIAKYRHLFACRERNQIGDNEEKNFAKQDLKSYYFLFMILSVGYLAAFLTFIFELLTPKKIKM